MNPISIPRMMQKAQGLLAKRGRSMRWRKEGPDAIRVVTPQTGPHILSRKVLSGMSPEGGALCVANMFSSIKVGQ